MPPCLSVCNSPCLVQLYEVVRPPCSASYNKLPGCFHFSIRDARPPEPSFSQCPCIRLSVLFLHSLTAPKPGTSLACASMAGSLQREAAQESLLSNCGVPRAAIDRGCSGDRSVCSRPPSAYSLTLLCVFTIQL